MSSTALPSWVIWNRTDSAPQGLYWRQNSLPNIGDWAIVSPKSSAAKWVSQNGYTGPNWPLIKRVAAKTGDKVCRIEEQVLINGRPVAVALADNFSEKKLPDWQGCRVLTDTEFFLLNAHPRSLDGRYFGPTEAQDIAGTALPVWTFPP